jgi:hypothetical protein
MHLAQKVAPQCNLVSEGVQWPTNEKLTSVSLHQLERVKSAMFFVFYHSQE